MNLPGFTPGERSQNAVVAAMYFVALGAIVVVAGLFLFGGFLGGGGTNTSQATPQTPAVSADQTQSQPQGQSNSSGWVTVTSSGNSGGSESDGSGSTDSVPSTQIIDENQAQLQVVRDTMANYSRVQLVSAEIRQNELYVRYTQENMSRSGIITGAGIVTGVYLGLVGTGVDLEAVNGRLVDDSGQVARNFTVDRELITRFNNGEISNAELRQQVAESLQLANQSTSSTNQLGLVNVKD